MTNLYSKAYQKNRENSVGFSSSDEAVEKLLEAASKMMLKAASCCETMDIESRALWSDKTIQILDHIEVALDRDTPLQQQAAQRFSEFNKSITNVLMFMNLRNDAKLAHVASQQLKAMSQLWSQNRTSQTQS